MSRQVALITEASSEAVANELKGTGVTLSVLCRGRRGPGPRSGPDNDRR